MPIPRGQISTFTYNQDNSLQAVVYTNVAIATPTVSYTYDPNYARVVTMVDGAGTTTYTYRTVGALGAIQLASVDGPLSNDTVTFGYDELGRVTERLINGTGVSRTFDSAGRVSTESTPLGSFTYAYDGVSQRVASVVYPNGQTSTYTYFGNAGDHRLQSIHHKRPDATTLSKFDYTYDIIGNVATWQKQADASSPVLWRYQYDPGNELQTAAAWSTDPTPVVLKRYAYTYDPAGNRLSEQIDDAVTTLAYNTFNRLVSRTAGGLLRVAGTVNEPATVTIDGKPATVGVDNHFDGAASVTAAAPSFTVVATDPNGNARTQQYSTSVGGSTRTFTYDANGNLTADGERTFEWDARNRLHAINRGAERWEYGYNGVDERVSEQYTAADASTTARAWIWCGNSVCEERDPTTNAITTREFTFGRTVGATSYFETVDHLGSPVELTDGTGALISRFSYDPYGRRTATGSSTLNGFTGMMDRQGAGLALAPYRAYDPAMGQWLSEDPSGDGAGVRSLYTYLSGNPVTFVDPDGLGPMKPVPGHPGWEYRHDPSAGGGDPPHTQYEHNGEPYARRVYKNKTQRPHGRGVHEDVPEDVVEDTPPNNYPGPDGPGQPDTGGAGRGARTTTAAETVATTARRNTKCATGTVRSVWFPSW